MSKGRFEGGVLYGLLPKIVRQRDEEVGKPLLKAFEAFSAQADRIEAEIARAYGNFFVETGDARALAHIADLVGYRPISVQDPNQPNAGTALLRRDIGRTIWARRRKGTPHVLGELVTSITGWRTVVFENGREVVTTPSMRFAASSPSTQGTPDVRKLVGPAGADQGPGLIPRVATVGRMGAHGIGARWHPLDVVVEVWPCRARLVNHVPAGRRSGYLTFSPTGGDTQLYASANNDVDVTSDVGSARALRRSDFVGKESDVLKERVYGPSGAVCLYRATYGRALEPIDSNKVRFGRISGPRGTHWLVDPELGRIRAPAGDWSTVYVRYLHRERNPDNDCVRAAAVEAKDRELMLDVVRTRLDEHVPMEARTGLVIRR